MQANDRGVTQGFNDTAAAVADQHGLTLSAALLRVTAALQMNPKVRGLSNPHLGPYLIPIYACAQVARCHLGLLPELLRQTSVSLSVAHEDAVRAALVREAGTRPILSLSRPLSIPI